MTDLAGYIHPTAKWGTKKKNINDVIIIIHGADRGGTTAGEGERANERTNVTYECLNEMNGWMDG